MKHKKEWHDLACCNLGTISTVVEAGSFSMAGDLGCGRSRVYSELGKDGGIHKFCVLASLNLVPAGERKLCFPGGPSKYLFAFLSCDWLPIFESVTLPTG